jgi:hypothetical protein
MVACNASTDVTAELPIWGIWNLLLFDFVASIRRLYEEKRRRIRPSKLVHKWCRPALSLVTGLADTCRCVRYGHWRNVCSWG